MTTMGSGFPLPTPTSGSEKLEYDHGTLRIREKTLVIGNSIFPISNISSVNFADLRTPIPAYVWVMLALGVVGMVIGRLSGSIAFIALLLFTGACYLLFQNWTSRSNVDYALSVRMNGGNTAVVTSNDGPFLKAIELELYEVIELERASNTTFNLDQKVMVDTITGSTVNVTGIHGDIANNVPV